MIAIGAQHVLALRRHPNLIDLSTGEVLYTWDDLRTGLQTGSIIWGLKDRDIPPPYAYDPVNNRFAMADGETITVISFDVAALQGL